MFSTLLLFGQSQLFLKRQPLYLAFQDLSSWFDNKGITVNFLFHILFKLLASFQIRIHLFVSCDFTLCSAGTAKLIRDNNLFLFTIIGSARMVGLGNWLESKNHSGFLFYFSFPYSLFCLGLFVQMFPRWDRSLWFKHLIFMFILILCFINSAQARR